jgi:hypothetical protein
MWVGGPAPFFPTPEAGESNMEIMFPEDGHGFALRQLILFAPRGKLFDREVDLASSYIGGIRFASLHFGSLSQLLKAFPLLLNVGRILIHVYSKYCDMSHDMAISIMNVSPEFGSRPSEINLRRRNSARGLPKATVSELWSRASDRLI